MSDQEPAAWAVQWNGKNCIDDEFVYRRFDDAKAFAYAEDCAGKCTIVPLYRHPQPPLTDAEREAVEYALVYMAADTRVAATLRGLLERCAISHKT